ncbi:hypothetical protein V8C26DRAFT_317267 [Trichoderma gracile]
MEDASRLGVEGRASANVISRIPKTWSLAKSRTPSQPKRPGLHQLDKNARKGDKNMLGNSFGSSFAGYCKIVSLFGPNAKFDVQSAHLLQRCFSPLAQPTCSLFCSHHRLVCCIHMAALPRSDGGGRNKSHNLICLGGEDVSLAPVEEGVCVCSRIEIALRCSGCLRCCRDGTQQPMMLSSLLITIPNTIHPTNRLQQPTKPQPLPCRTSTQEIKTPPPTSSANPQGAEAKRASR